MMAFLGVRVLLAAMVNVSSLFVAVVIPGSNQFSFIQPTTTTATPNLVGTLATGVALDFGVRLNTDINLLASQQTALALSSPPPIYGGTTAWLLSGAMPRDTLTRLGLFDSEPTGGFDLREYAAPPRVVSADTASYTQRDDGLLVAYAESSDGIATDIPADTPLRDLAALLPDAESRIIALAGNNERFLTDGTIGALLSIRLSLSDQDKGDVSALIGELAGLERFLRDHPGAVILFTGKGKGVFDAGIWCCFSRPEHKGRVYDYVGVVEFKGGSSPLGTSEVDQINFQQGHPVYVQKVAAEMLDALEQGKLINGVTSWPKGLPFRDMKEFLTRLQSDTADQRAELLYYRTTGRRTATGDVQMVAKVFSKDPDHAFPEAQMESVQDRVRFVAPRVATFSSLPTDSKGRRVWKAPPSPVRQVHAPQPTVKVNLIKRTQQQSRPPSPLISRKGGGIDRTAAGPKIVQRTRR